MHADDHRPGLAPRLPTAEAQPRAVKGDEHVLPQARTGEKGVRRLRVLSRGGAGRERGKGRQNDPSRQAAGHGLTSPATLWRK